MSEYLMEIKNISKSFGGVHALEDLSLDLKYNENLGLVGDNGAGKSTLIKILAGVIRMDSGEVFIEDKKVAINSPEDAWNLGIETVYQDLALIDELDVSSNMFLGREIKKGLIGNFMKIFLDSRSMEETTKKVLGKFDIEVQSVRTKIRNLSGGQRQAVAIGRSASYARRIVLMDEPLAAMGIRESSKVFDIIRKLKEEEKSIIIISHNLQHVFSLADRITVIRHGRKIGTRVKSETNTDEIVKMITGTIKD